MDTDLSTLEHRVEALIAHAAALRETNERLERDLVAAQERNRDLAARLAQAGSRLDALIARVAAS
jgi:chromosome segregation ATPase